MSWHDGVLQPQRKICNFGVEEIVWKIRLIARSEVWTEDSQVANISSTLRIQKPKSLRLLQ
eukprot:2501063-Amphidinium_carterae.1